MTRTEVDRWTTENKVTSTATFYANKIDYLFATLPDGWIAIFENAGGDYIPLIQAADRAHAETYCVMREPLPVPCEQI